MQLGGHYVSDADVIRRYYRGAKNFWQVYKNLADRWYLYNNSLEGFDLVALGEKHEFAVKNNELFNMFSHVIEEK